MITILKMIIQKNKYSELMIPLAMIIMTWSAIKTSKIPVEEIFNTSTMGIGYIWCWGILLWLLIIINLKSDTTLLLMPVRKKDIVKGYYLFSLIYIMMWVILSAAVKIFIFKYCNINNLPLQSLGLSMLKDILAITLIISIVFPISIVVNRQILLLIWLVFLFINTFNFVNGRSIEFIFTNNEVFIVMLALLPLFIYISYRATFKVFNRYSLI